MKYTFLCIYAAFIFSCNNISKEEKKIEGEAVTPTETIKDKVDTVTLPAPYATESVKNFSKVIGWPAGKTPMAPAGFTVSKFADSLDNPRWIYVADNGDIFIAESNSAHSTMEKLTGKNKSADRITLFRDANNDGIAEMKSVFLKGLNKPFGMLVVGNSFYVANTDGIMLFPYTVGSTSITAKGKEIIKLPASLTQRHWTKNIIANATGDKIYVAIGSSSNVAENGIDKETRRADILEINTDGTGERVYASGLRNPVGMGWAGNTLWTAVNERDELGDELVPDYLTSVKENGFYGWPYSYFGQHIDPRMKDKLDAGLVAKAIVPDMSLGAHTASLGLAFYNGNNFPAKYKGGAFIGQHGSWNRSVFSGYRVAFVPFNNGKPSGKAEDFLTGFIADESKKEVYGRPVGVAVLKDGSLLVADDAGNTIWRISAAK